MGLEQGQHCLLCSSEIPPAILPDLPDNTPSSCSLLDKHLEVIFLLRKVLEVPVSQLAKYLEGCPNVEGWIRVCDSCAEAVKQCKLIYRELLEANRKWRECKREIVGIIKGKKVAKGEQSEEGSDFEVDIPQSIRLFAKSRKCEDWSDPFVIGDQKAAEKLQTLVPNVLVKEEVAYLDNPSPWRPSPEPDDNHPIVSSDPEYNPEVDYTSNNEVDHDYKPNAQEAVTKKPKRQYRKQKVKGPPKKAPSKQPVDCHICGRTLSCQMYLKYHLYSRHGIGTLKHQCPRCQRMFPSTIHLRNHTKVCVRKTEVTPDGIQRLKPESRPSRQPVNCHICGLTILSQSSLKVHLYTKHAIGLPFKFPCPHCQKKFQTQIRLDCHLKSCIKSVDATPMNLQTDEHFMPPGNHFRVKCPLPGCSQTWPIVSAYRAHMQMQHTPEERKGLGTRPQILECLTCGKLVRTKDDALIHRFSHDESLRKEYEIVCEFCGVAVVGKKRLHDHQKYSLQCRLLQGKSEAETTVVCDICGKRLANQGCLKLHVRRVHDKNFRYTCQLCGAGYAETKGLRGHLARVHGIKDEKFVKKPKKRVELQCPVEGCGKIINGRAKLRDHQKNVHSEGEPDQKCEECGKAFYTKTSLYQHVKLVHQGYKPNRKRDLLRKSRVKVRAGDKSEDT